MRKLNLLLLVLVIVLRNCPVLDICFATSIANRNSRGERISKRTQSSLHLSQAISATSSNRLYVLAQHHFPMYRVFRVVVVSSRSIASTSSTTGSDFQLDIRSILDPSRCWLHGQPITSTAGVTCLKLGMRLGSEHFPCVSPFERMCTIPVVSSDVEHDLIDQILF